MADPKFLHRLAIEEAISITTTLLAQYERRKGSFFEELDYVITDTVRGSVVDFFTVWLPAPTLSFLPYADGIAGPESMDALKGLLGFIPDNAFQKNIAGKDWNLSHRVISVLVGGLKLAGVGFVSSIGAVAASNLLYAIRRALNPALSIYQRNKRSPIFKTAAVYGCFLGTSANLRYQVKGIFLTSGVKLKFIFLLLGTVIYHFKVVIHGNFNYKRPYTLRQKEEFSVEKLLDSGRWLRHSICSVAHTLDGLNFDVCLKSLTHSNVPTI